MIATATCKVRELLKENDIEFSKLESASLRLHKFIRLEKTDDSKRKEIEAVCNLINKSVRASSISDWSLPKGVTKSGKTIVLKLEGRLALHLAGGVLENAGMSIHPHFNCPWMPGSGVKGVARHAAWCRWQESQSKEDAFNLAWVFGYSTGENKLDAFLKDNGWNYETWAGTISFLPAFPVKNDFKAMVDIATSHHPDYYSGKSENSYDSENPVPLPFPVIEAGSSFQFTIRPVQKNGLPEDAPSIEKLLGLAEEFLKEGMTLYGAGAKTAAGYGWFSDDKELSDKIATKQKEEEALRQKEKEEAERKAALSPEQLACEQYITKLGTGDITAPFKNKMSTILGLEEDEQKIVCLLLRDHEMFKRVWANDVKDAVKAETQTEKKRAKNKGYKRVNAVRPIAEKLGVKLP